MLLEEGEWNVEAEELADSEQHGTIGWEGACNAWNEASIKALDAARTRTLINRYAKNMRLVLIEITKQHHLK